MKKKIKLAIIEVIEAFEQPTGSGGLSLAPAIYQLKKVYESEIKNEQRRKITTITSQP